MRAPDVLDESKYAAQTTDEAKVAVLEIKRKELVEFLEKADTDVPTEYRMDNDATAAGGDSVDFDMTIGGMYDKIEKASQHDTLVEVLDIVRFEYWRRNTLLKTGSLYRYVGGNFVRAFTRPIPAVGEAPIEHAFYITNVYDALMLYDATPVSVRDESIGQQSPTVFLQYLTLVWPLDLVTQANLVNETERGQVSAGTLRNRVIKVRAVADVVRGWWKSAGQTPLIIKKRMRHTQETTSAPRSRVRESPSDVLTITTPDPSEPSTTTPRQYDATAVEWPCHHRRRRLARHDGGS